MAVKRQRKTVRFKKRCIFCKDKTPIDYKDVGLLSKFINVKGKITSRRVNGNCAKHQRKLAKAIKRARFLALLPYSAR
ncbi:MAG TPA: 30S ribosomal protein S18 [Candidatus Omnitrophica bacterium]|nr:MAG: 30S ribosomal protein S18 [Candidatus Omnitrophota bacterium]RKY45013.1 MAG: 30S ribosomal protein S18 [Candidatus Omnitrophota bacterium]HEC69474.1 30S ribosomal protein S18 [Candidatus Omnitrophota bacterium]